MAPPDRPRHPFIRALLDHFPELRDDLDQSDGFGLLHVEMTRFAKRSLEAFRAGDLDTVRRHFAFVEGGFDDAGDLALINALHVSYVEEFAWGFEEDRAARALMPPRLTDAFDQMVIAWRNL